MQRYREAYVAGFRNVASRLSTRIYDPSEEATVFKFTRSRSVVRSKATLTARCRFVRRFAWPLKAAPQPKNTCICMPLTRRFKTTPLFLEDSALGFQSHFIMIVGKGSNKPTPSEATMMILFNDKTKQNRLGHHSPAYVLQCLRSPQRVADKKKKGGGGAANWHASDTAIFRSRRNRSRNDFWNVSIACIARQ